MLGLPLTASASSIIFPSTGGKASSMAGAWVAQGDDLSVMDHNPAEMVRFDRYGVEGHYTAYNYSASFDPDPIVGIGDPPAATNTGDFVNHIPNFYGLFPVSERWRIGAGLFTPVGPRHTYGDSGAQRYMVQQAQVQLAWITVSAAYKILDNLAASLSLDTAYVSAYQKIGLGLFPGFRSFDGSIIVEGGGIQIPRPKVGLLWDISPEWHLGFVGAPGMDLNIRGTISADVPQVGFDPETATDEVVASQRYPSEARLGLGWTPGNFRAEAGLRYYRWSEYKEQTINLTNNNIGGFEIADLSVKKDYRDTVAFQIGGGYRFLRDHEVRAGYAYDGQAPSNSSLTINDFDAPKHILALGYGYDISPKWQVNVAFNHSQMEERRVTDSAHEAIAVLGTPPAMGNGLYKWGVQTFSIQTGYWF